jgi:hypothetical protein
MYQKSSVGRISSEKPASKVGIKLQCSAAVENVDFLWQFIAETAIHYK